jgi:hypothetical protein
MTMRFLTTVFLGLSMFALPALAQETPEVANSQGAVLRGLDTITQVVTDIPMKVGETTTYERLQVTLKGCRYPVSNPSSDAFAYVEIIDPLSEDRGFSGWMIASSPGLSALDHPRYDIWLLRCDMTGVEVEN